MTTKLGIIWDSEINKKGEKPFIDKYNHLNSTYQYFTDIADEKGLKVYIANFESYKNGRLEKAFIFKKGEWVEEQNIKLDLVLDKFKHDDQTKKIKEHMNKSLPVLNPYELEKIAKDKYLTFKEFPELVSDTKKATKENVSKFIQEDGRAVIKPPKDFGGKGIKVIDSIQDFEEKDNNLLVQRFIDSTNGIPELGVEGVHDLRVVVVSGEPVISYLRTPEGGFISNVSQGGSIEFIELDEVPEEVMDIVEKINQRFEKLGPYVYGVDTIFDEEGKPWILEINSKPGLSFYDDEEIREKKEPYIKAVIDALVELH